MAWTKNHIEKLARDGRIRGFVDKGVKKKETQEQRLKFPPKKGKALEWLEWNLMYWSNERALSMVREHQFDEQRKWRFDFCWPAIRVALEFEGGIFLAKSGHNTAKHYNKDTDKYNRAAVLGWDVIRVTAMNYKSSLQILNEIVCQKLATTPNSATGSRSGKSSL